jgi:hypothetical protein
VSENCASVCKNHTSEHSGQNSGRRTITFATSVDEVVFVVMMSVVAVAGVDAAVACSDHVEVTNVDVLL